MSDEVSPLSIAGAATHPPRHVCAFFHSDDEHYRVLLPFLREGFQQGDKIVQILSEDRRIDYLQRLASAGIDVAAAVRTGQLEVRGNTEVYLRDGRFDVDRMLAAFEQTVSAEEKGPFPRSRIVCHMEWAADHRACIDDVIEFESRVTEVWRRHQSAVICTYDLTRFGGGTVVDIIRTHPLVIMGGVLQHNPFFVPPEEFLRDRRARQGLKGPTVPPAG
jgi:hypothetical protein